MNNYDIIVVLTGSANHTIYLMPIYGGVKNRDNIPPIDSIKPVNDTFHFRGKFTESGYYSISIDSSSKFRNFIIDTGSIYIIGHIDTFWAAKIRNSYQNDLYRKFTLTTNPVLMLMNEAAEKHQDQMPIHQVLSDSIISFTKLYPQSYASILFSYELIGLPSGIYSQILAKQIYPLFTDEIKRSKIGQLFYFRTYLYNADSILGENFPVLKTNDIFNKKRTISLDTNYIYLIDYWASWCVPCIEKLPGLKKLYRKYQKRNFKIVSISMDGGYKTWTNAIKKHQISWENYSALNGFDTEDAKYFNITSIPYTILVGKGNKIIRLNPTDEEVEEYLKAHLN